MTRQFNQTEGQNEIPEGMEVKEGIVLDENDNPIAGPEPRPQTLSYGFSVGPWIGALLLVGLFLAGVTLFAVGVAIFLGFWLIRSLLRIVGLRPSQQR